MDKFLVSIVVPVYNTEKYLESCINSIINQTYKNIEIILVDDGSKDNSSKICDEMALNDNRLIVIHKENEGAGKSRNKGISVATGDYILFVDSDDYIKDDLIEKCMNAIIGEKSAIVMFGIENVNKNGDLISVNIPYSNNYVFLGQDVTNIFLPEMIFSTNKEIRNLEIPACMANFYSMDVIRRVEWKFESEREYFSEDLYSLLKLYRYINKVVVVNEALYCYRHTEGSLSSSVRILDYPSIRKYYLQCLYICELNNYSDEMIKRVSEPYLSFTIVCLKTHMLLKEGLYSKYRKIKQILQDKQLSKVISERDFSKEKLTKQILYQCILKKKYKLVFILIYLQTIKKGGRY